MPRTARVVVDGGTYHILTQGNNGQVLFHCDADYERYLQLLAAYSQSHRLSLYHYVLMPNHVHLILQVERGESLSKVMLGLNLAYTLRYRKRYQYRGHLWQGRFKSSLINRDSELLKYGRSIELNPVRSGLVQDPLIYPWSSYPAYATGANNPLLAPHPLYEVLGASVGERQVRYRQFVLEALKLKPNQAHTPDAAPALFASQRANHLPGWLRFPGIRESSRQSVAADNEKR